MPSIFRRAALLSALSLAAPATAGAQSQVYALESGRLPLSCSAGGCHAPTVHLIRTFNNTKVVRITVQ